jgi:hypothetical protein
MYTIKADSIPKTNTIPYSFYIENCAKQFYLEVRSNLRDIYVLQNVKTRKSRMFLL